MLAARGVGILCPLHRYRVTAIGPSAPIATMRGNAVRNSACFKGFSGLALCRVGFLDSWAAVSRKRDMGSNLTDFDTILDVWVG